MVDHSARRDAGAALVEFALILPVLCMFLFAIVQFGIAYDKKQSINSAAREGARMAAIPNEPTATNPGVTYDTIFARVEASFQGAGTDGVDQVEVYTVDPTDATETPVRTCTTTGCTPATTPATSSPCSGQEGQTVIVSATVAHKIEIPFVGGRTVDLTGEGKFRCEIDA